MPKKGPGPTHKVLAEATGVSERHVRRDVAAGADVSSVESYKAWRSANRRPKGKKDGVSVGEETARLRAAQAELAELQAAEKRGELVPFEDVKTIFMEAMVMVGSQLDGLSGRLANQLASINDAAEIRQLLLNETRQIRATAAAHLEDWGRAMQRGEGAPPAPEADH